MKNDFREFYDEDYIMHSMSDDELMHGGEWKNKAHRYINKIKTAFGWKYVYPEDVNTAYQMEQRKASKGLTKVANRKALKAKISQAKYDLGAAVSKLTGKNKKFDQRVVNPRQAEYTKNQKQKNAMLGDSRYKSRNAMAGESRYTPSPEALKKRQFANAKANQMYYDKTAQRHAKKEATKRAATQRHASIAGQKYYDKGSSAYRMENLNNAAKAHANALKATKERNERQLRAANANKQYYDQGYIKAKSLEKNKERNSRRLSKKRKNPATVIRNASSKKRG